MARAFNGSSQYCRVASAVVSGAPLTLACWYYSTSTAALQTLIEVSRTGLAAVTDKYRLILRGDLSAGSKTLQAQQSPGFLATSTVEYSANTWQHACGTLVTTSSRTVYLDGGNSATDTTPGSPGAVGQTMLGVAWDSGGAGSFTQYTAGRIAEAAIWNVALDSMEVRALARGYSPLEIRPASLVAYWPLGGHYGQFDLDRWKNKHDMTPSGSPTLADHPRIVYPRPIVWPQRVVAAAATPWLYARRRSQIIGAGGVQ
jgi:hypothetical protein